MALVAIWQISRLEAPQVGRKLLGFHLQIVMATFNRNLDIVIKNFLKGCCRNSTNIYPLELIQMIVMFYEIYAVYRINENIQYELINELTFQGYSGNKYGCQEYKIMYPRILVLKFPIAPPKPEMVTCLVDALSSEHIDRIAREEKKFVLQIIKKILAIKCNVVLIQRILSQISIDILGQHYLMKKKIMLIRNVGENDIESIANIFGCKPCQTLDELDENAVGSAKCIEQLYDEDLKAKINKITIC